MIKTPCGTSAFFLVCLNPDDTCKLSFPLILLATPPESIFCAQSGWRLIGPPKLLPFHVAPPATSPISYSALNRGGLWWASRPRWQWEGFFHLLHVKYSTYSPGNIKESSPTPYSNTIWQITKLIAKENAGSTCNELFYLHWLDLHQLHFLMGMDPVK